ATSSTLSSSKQYMTWSVVITSRTGVSGPFPCATARTAMSRSVIIPTRRSFSPTGRLPASISAISRATSRIVCPGVATRTSRVIASHTFMIHPPLGPEQFGTREEDEGSVVRLEARAHERATVIAVQILAARLVVARLHAARMAFVAVAFVVRFLHRHRFLRRGA